MKRISLGVAALLAAVALWLPALHFCFAAEPDPSPLLRHQLALLEHPDQRASAVAVMRSANPEWDLMGSSFTAWALANWALREPTQRDQALRQIDALLEATLRTEATQGIYAFLLPYARDKFVVEPAHSLFVDSEIALTCSLRRLVRDDRADLRALCQKRVEEIAARLRAAPLHLVESYPDEGWTFDHAVALAALKVNDKLDGADHSDVIAAFLATARSHLIDPRSGLLVSSFTAQGRALDGPEGSTLWMSLHCLQLVDEPFARAQYQLARAQLGAQFLGFGWGREWPAGWRGRRDIDSGPVIPLVDVSAGSSGLMFVAAASFGDREVLRRLHTTLDFAAFPIRGEDGTRYAASNQLGDAALLYALELGPAWEKVK